MRQYINTRKSILLDSKYWEFFVPTILMAMTLTMSIVVDSIIVGNMLGADALAAVNLVMPVIMTYTSVAVTFGLGGATLISVAKGRRQSDYANDIFTASIAGMVGLSILLLIGQEIFLEDIVRLLTREPSLRPLVLSYLHVLVYGTPLMICIPGLVYSLRIDGMVRLASTVLIVSNLVNLALDLVYMGPLKMGIAGSSLATVSGYVVGIFFLLTYIFSKERTLRFIPGTLAHVSETLKHIWKIVKTGTPAAMGSILITIKILSVNHIILAVAGKSGMVAFSVCLSCLSFVSMFISGAAQAMTPIVGVLYGEVDFTGVRFVVIRAAKILLLSSIGVCLLLEVAPGLVMQMFGVHHAADIAEGIPAIRIFSLSLIGTSITFLSMYYYMTIGCTKLSTAISVVQGISVVPFALALSQLWGSAGVWIAFSVAEIVTIFMIAACIGYLIRKSPQSYNSPLLLDQKMLDGCSIFETTVADDTVEKEEVEKGTADFLHASGQEWKMVDAIRTTTINMIDSIAEQAYPKDKKGYLDLIMQAYDDRVVVRLRDQGKYTNLDNGGVSSQPVAENVSIEQAQAIGFNTTILTYTR